MTGKRWLRSCGLSSRKSIRNRRRLPSEEVAENRAFLQWLTEDHFLLLGYRRHDLATVDGEDALRLVPGSGLGILRESETETALSGSFAVLPPEARAVAHAVSPMMFVTKANSRSTVHRPGYIDYIGVKRYKDGVVIGEHRFVGLVHLDRVQRTRR